MFPLPKSGAEVARASQQNLFNVVGYPCVVLFVFFFYSRVLDLGLPYLHLPLLFGLCAAGAALASGNLKSVLSSRITIALLLFTAWACMAVPFSIWRGGSFDVVVNRWFKSMVVYFAVGCLAGSLSQLTRMMRWIAGGILIACCIALAFNTTHWDGRLCFPTGELANANQLAFAATNGITALWVIVGNARHRLIFRLAAGLAAGIPVVVLSRTGSRAGLVCFSLVVLTILLAMKGRKRLIAIALATVAAVAVLLAPGPVQRRFFTTMETSATEEELVSAGESAQSRLSLLKDGVDLTARYPIFGVGPGNYAVKRNDILERTSARSDWSVTHNTYVQVSSECGVPGLIFYLGSIFFCFAAIRKAVKIARELPAEFDELKHVGLCLTMCMVTTAAFFAFSSSAYEIYYPTVAGLVVALERIAVEAKRRREAPAPQAVPLPARPPRFAAAAPRRNRPGLAP